jgi:hypothetical protein
VKQLTVLTRKNIANSFRNNAHLGKQVKWQNRRNPFSSIVGHAMIKFPLSKLLDEQACYEWLLNILHPKGLHCPNGHALPAGQAPHDRKRAPIVKYKRRECGKVFHIFTGTDLSDSHYNCGQIASNGARILTRTNDTTHTRGVRTGLWDGIGLAASHPTPGRTNRKTNATQS